MVMDVDFGHVRKEVMVLGVSEVSRQVSFAESRCWTFHSNFSIEASDQY